MIVFYDPEITHYNSRIYDSRSETDNTAVTAAASSQLAHLSVDIAHLVQRRPFWVLAGRGRCAVMPLCLSILWALT